VTVEKLFFVTGSGSRFKIESNSMAVVDPVIGVQILWLVVPQVNHCRKIGADVGDRGWREIAIELIVQVVSAIDYITMSAPLLG
jgi:hypothetical protein